MTPLDKVLIYHCRDAGQAIETHVNAVAVLPWKESRIVRQAVSLLSRDVHTPREPVRAILRHLLDLTPNLAGILAGINHAL